MLVTVPSRVITYVERLAEPKGFFSVEAVSVVKGTMIEVVEVVLPLS